MEEVKDELRIAWRSATPNKSSEKRMEAAVGGEPNCKSFINP
jgi:hypothetical protein